MAKPLALIIGAGPGISFSFGKKLYENGYHVCFASRSIEKLDALSSSIQADNIAVDCSSNESIIDLFNSFDAKYNNTAPSVVLYTASAGFAFTGECGTLDYRNAITAVQTSAIGAFTTCQEAGRRMLPLKKGCIFLSGATAGIKGYPKRSIFAMGKFALRGLAQSMYKELSPSGIHVCHFVIDGAVRPWPNETIESLPPDTFTADAIAESYISVLKQPAAAWSWEIELRSKDEKF